MNLKTDFNVELFLTHLGKTELCKTESLERKVIASAVKAAEPMEIVREIRWQLCHSNMQDDELASKVIKAYLISASPADRRAATDYFFQPFLEDGEDDYIGHEYTKFDVGVGVVTGTLQAVCWLEQTWQNTPQADSEYPSFLMDRLGKLLEATYGGPGSGRDRTVGRSIGVLVHNPSEDCKTRLTRAAFGFAYNIDSSHPVRQERRVQIEKLRQRLLAYADERFGNKKPDEWSQPADLQKIWRWSADVIMGEFMTAAMEDAPLQVCMRQVVSLAPAELAHRD